MLVGKENAAEAEGGEGCEWVPGQTKLEEKNSVMRLTNKLNMGKYWQYITANLINMTHKLHLYFLMLTPVDFNLALLVFIFGDLETTCQAC